VALILLVVACVDHGEEYLPALGISGAVACAEGAPPTLTATARTTGPIDRVTLEVTFEAGEARTAPLALESPAGEWAGEWLGPPGWQDCEDGYPSTYAILGVGEDGRELRLETWIDGDTGNLPTP
jgi:hypothetical protein